MVIILVLMLSFNAYAATEASKFTASHKMIDSVLDKMEQEEKLSAEKRYENLRKIFIGKLGEELGKCAECDNDITKPDSEEFNNAADIYIKDLKERETKN
jgi:hypothetical protein